MTDTSFNWATFRDNGYYTLPVVLGAKLPGYICLNGKIERLSDWTQFGVEYAQEWQMAMWSDLKCGVGIVCTNVVAVDLDIEDPAQAWDYLSQIVSRWPGAVKRSRSNSSKCLLLFRKDGEIANKSIKWTDENGIRQGLDILSTDRQFVAFNVHKSGVEYEWNSGCPMTVRVDELPVLNQADVLELLSWFPQSATALAGQMAESRQAIANPSIEAAQFIMERLPNDERFADRNAWIRVCAALKVATIEDEALGFALWDAWSQKHESYAPDATRHAWRSFRPNGNTGLGTLVKLARECGIKIPTSIRFSNDEPRGNPIIAQLRALKM